MSVRVRFLSSGDAGTVGTVGRSASFAGFSSAQSRRIAKSINRNSVRSRVPGKSTKAYGTLRKGSVCLDPKPQQVKKICEALKRGLRDHLCEQQAELDYLCGRHTDTRRGSRLAFYYDLDKKQTRSVERQIRKMEFHISKVDELYEAYCIQWRLRDGASNMQRAFGGGPQSRASRESLQELGRSLHACTEDMWLIEGALEVHLGEFHVRMKGLVGYARLCPGDQYEVLMRLGRQRWKLKGRIESDDSQTWDEEEKAFVPTLHENLEIKVTETRGLSSLVVGTVTCDIADFFTARPQVVVVDITELGTVKLQLEVLWNPLDSESLLVSPSPTGRFSVGSRKGSLYTWTPPSTPSFRERYYLSVLQQPARQALLLHGPRATSVLSYLSDNGLEGSSLQSRSQELLEMDSFGSEDPRDPETSTSASTSDVGFLPLATGPSVCTEEEIREQPPPLGLLPALMHPTRGALVERPGWRDLGEESPRVPWDSSFQNHRVPKGQEEEDTGDGVEGPLQEVLELLRSTDSTQPQLRELEYQVLGLRDRLKPRGPQQEPVSAQSLMDYILESFAFLNADLASDELSLFGGSQSPGKDSPPPPRPSLKASPGSELTAGGLELDELLTVHLQVCKALLQKLSSPNLSAMVQGALLEEVAHQKQVLEVIADLDCEKVSKATSVEDVIPQALHRKSGLALWRGCTQPGRVLACPATTLLSQLKRMFLHRVRGKYPGQLEIVCRRLLEQVVSCCGLLPWAGLPEEEPRVTWFQLCGYLQRQGVADMEKHLAQLTKEVTLIEELHCSAQAKAIRKLQGKRLGQLQPLPQTLKAWALLQLDGPPRVSRVASARLAGAARNRRFREKALLFYTNALSENDAKLQQAACMALKQLGGIESIEQIASLCQSDLEAVRAAAREATLSFGEKGRLVFEKMDRLCSEKREVFCQEADVEITVF